jgi:hypothetical protein
MARKRAKSSGGGDDDFNPEEKYDEFPSGESLGYGRRHGFDELVQINQRRWFTEEAQANPVINAFLEAYEEEAVAFSYLQVKSSTSESEWFIHKPDVALSENPKSGIAGVAPGFEPGQHIGTFVINHHRTLAFRIVRAMAVSDGTEVGTIVHKGS